MKKIFVIVAVPVNGDPIAEVGDNYTPLLERAKATRVAGLFGKVPCSEVHVLSSQNFGALRYRCIQPPAKAKGSK